MAYPFVLRMAYFRVIRSEISLSARISFRIFNSPAAISGSDAAKRSSTWGSSVSIIVPVARTIFMETIEWYESIAGRQRIPPALLASMPPIVAALMLAGSGPMRRPYAFNTSLMRPSVVPTLQRIRAPVLLDFPAAPVLPHIDQDVVALRLAIQACATSPEGRVATFASAVSKNCRHVIDVFGLHDHFRDISVRAGVRCVAHQVTDAMPHKISAKHPD